MAERRAFFAAGRPSGRADRRGSGARVLALAGLLVFSAGPASAQVSGYLTDTLGGHVKDPYNLCWRTGYWTPALAVAECDPDLVAKPAPPPAPPVPPPAPKPPPPPAVAPPAPPPPAPAPAPKPAPKPVAEKVSLRSNVLFDFDRSALRPDGRRSLDGLLDLMAGVSLEVIIAIGHADRIGATDYNERLSVRRAESIKAYLVSKGVAPERIYTEGKGEGQPVTGDECRKLGAETEANKKLVACLQADRRVEIEVVGTRTR